MINVKKHVFFSPKSGHGFGFGHWIIFGFDFKILIPNFVNLEKSFHFKVFVVVFEMKKFSQKIIFDYVRGSTVQPGRKLLLANMIDKNNSSETKNCEWILIFSDWFFFINFKRQTNSSNIKTKLKLQIYQEIFFRYHFAHISLISLITYWLDFLFF